MINKKMVMTALFTVALSAVLKRVPVIKDYL